MNAINTNEQHKSTAMKLDLALGNGGKASKAVRSTAPVLISAVFTGVVTSEVLDAARAATLKGTSAEIANLFESLVKAL